MRKAGILPGIGAGVESFMDGGAPNTRIAVCDVEDTGFTRMK